jgi:hypothetical protein
MPGWRHWIAIAGGAGLRARGGRGAAVGRVGGRVV